MKSLLAPIKTWWNHTVAYYTDIVKTKALQKVLVVLSLVLVIGGVSTTKIVQAGVVADWVLEDVFVDMKDESNYDYISDDDFSDEEAALSDPYRFKLNMPNTVQGFVDDDTIAESLTISMKPMIDRKEEYFTESDFAEMKEVEDDEGNTVQRPAFWDDWEDNDETNANIVQFVESAPPTVGTAPPVVVTNTDDPETPVPDDEDEDDEEYDYIYD